MPRKVFISVLGATFYEKGKYGRKECGFLSKETRFIQQATLEYLTAEKWNENDAAYILTTERARTENWNKTITKRIHPTRGEEEYTGLEQVIDNMHLPFPTVSVPIKDGNNEDEMWAIFQGLYDCLQEKDELYLDLTHSFRYIPMLMLVLGNYAKFLKHVKIRSITYGNFEAGKLCDDKVAPIIDLLPLTMLQDWTFAAADLIRNGNSEQLQELTKENALQPVLRSKGKKNLERMTVEQPLSEYVKALRDMLADMKLCLAPSIIWGKSINATQTYYSIVQKRYSELIAPIPPIVNTIQNSFSQFRTTNALNPVQLQNGYEAAKWCYEHQLFQQAFTILDENITTHFCSILETDNRNYKQRKATNALLRHGKYDEDDWKDDELDEVKKKVQIITREKKEINEFIKAYGGVAKWIHNKRNTYNHASMGQDTLTYGDIEDLGKKIAFFH